MTDILPNKLAEHNLIYVATNGRSRWGICLTIHIGGFFLYECGTNWYVISRGHFDTIQEAMDSAQLAENVPLLWNEVQPHIEIIKRQRESEKLKDKYGSLFHAVSKLLFTSDPLGVNFENNIDEYDPEAERILSQIHTYKNEDELQRMIYGIFHSTNSALDNIAKELWHQWLAYSENKET